MIQSCFKADNARIAALVLSAISLFFSVFAIVLSDYGLDTAFYPSAIPAYNGGNLSATISVLPGIVLLVGMVAFKGREREIVATVASGIQLLALLMYYADFCYEPSDFITNLPQLLTFSAFPLTAISFGSSLFVLLRDEDASLLAIIGAALTAIAILLTIVGVAPFGDSDWGDYYLSTLLHYSATWLAIPMAFASAETSSLRTAPMHFSPKASNVMKQSDEAEVFAASVETVKQLKGLLDSGAITQEEYDKKKAELLRL